MDVHVLVRTAVVLLAIAALGGLAMAGTRFAGRPHPPPLIAMMHGVFAASGLALLLVVGFAATLPRAAWAGTVLLLLAAGGGLVLNLAFHWRNRALPIWLMLVHAGIAVAGFTVLAVVGWKL